MNMYRLIPQSSASSIQNRRFLFNAIKVMRHRARKLKHGQHCGLVGTPTRGGACQTASRHLYDTARHDRCLR